MSDLLSRKLRKTLEHVRMMTDKAAGMYPGEWWESAPKQHAQLMKRGYVTQYIPHNGVHKTRAIITDSGREALER